MLRLVILEIRLREQLSFISVIICKNPMKEEFGLTLEMEDLKVYINFQKTGLLILNGKEIWSIHQDALSCCLINGQPFQSLIERIS
jgi:hypothetical protein